MRTVRSAWLCVGFGAVGFVLTTAGLVHASNQWSCWHWNKNTIAINNAAGGYWGGIIGGEFADWDAGTCIDFTGGGNEIIGDAGFYGINGWLGIAQILQYDSDCSILQAQALMNRSYLDGSSYDQIDDEHVSCQEIGHTIGLDHRKGPRNETCMNDQFLGFPDFDQHDADVVNSITVGCSGGGDPCDNNGENGRRKCTDGIDNDGDGCIDGDDPDCQ